MYDIFLAEKLAESEPHRLAAFRAFDDLAFPVWKRIRILENAPPAYSAYNNQKILFHRQDGINVDPSPVVTASDYELLGDRSYGPSQKHRHLVEAFANAGTRIEVGDGIQAVEPIVVRMEMNEENPLLLDRHTLKVGRDASVTVVYDYSDSNVEAYHCGLLNIFADTGARVHVVKLQNMASASTHIYGGLSLIAGDALVRYNSVDLGAGLTVTDYSSYLEEENGQTAVDSIYLAEGCEKLDLGYNTYHTGRRTESDVTVKGALLDRSRKVFRGNLYFAKGAKRARGSEEEYVILLDEGVKADAIPALMCDEDDVQGEHAASAGQVDEDRLFYLMSRGLTEKESKELIIMASFAPVIEQLPSVGLRDRVHETVANKLTEELGQ